MTNKQPLIIDNKIVIIFEDVDSKELTRIEQGLEIILKEKILETKNGKSILHFDNDKNIREVEFNYKKRI